MDDLLLILGLAVLAAAGFLVCLVAGLVVVGLGLIVASLAFSDGKGFTWRS